MIETYTLKRRPSPSWQALRADILMPKPLVSTTKKSFIVRWNSSFRCSPQNKDTASHHSHQCKTNHHRGLVSIGFNFWNSQGWTIQRLIWPFIVVYITYYPHNLQCNTDTASGMDMLFFPHLACYNTFNRVRKKRINASKLQKLFYLIIDTRGLIQKIWTIGQMLKYTVLYGAFSYER